MKTAVLIGAGGMVAAALYVATKNRASMAEMQDWSGAFMDDATEEAAQLFDSLTGGILRLSAMGQVTPAMVTHPNVQAFLRVIRRGEGTGDSNGYRRLFGGELFASYADHPRKAVTRTMGGKPITSTAAGAYQFLSRTWDETRAIMKLEDFSPASQDRAAVGRIAARGALADVMAGRFEAAIAKCAREWASLPGSPYGQPVISMQTAQAVYTNSGGVFA